MKKYNFLNINPSNYDCVKISHAFALHLSSNSFKTMFLSGWKYVSNLCIFSSFKKAFFGKNHVFSENFIVNTF